MEYHVLSLPPFTAVTSGPDARFDFSEEGVLGKFDKYFSAIHPLARDSFMPRDFLFFNKEKGGMEWWWALADGMPDGGFEKVDFDGGYYVVYTYRDDDRETGDRMYGQALQWIADSNVFALDERPGHYAMGHIVTPPDVIEAQGYAVMETFVPVRLLK